MRAACRLAKRPWVASSSAPWTPMWPASASRLCAILQHRRLATAATASSSSTSLPQVTYERLTHIDHALARPGMYVGSTSLSKQARFVVKDLSALEFEHAQVSFVPALVKMFDEVLVNACDNAVRDPKGTLHIDAAYDGEVFSVSNDGQGVPVRKHLAEKDLWIPEMVFGEMLTGSNFADGNETTGGRHGLGAKVCNIFSTWFKVETQDAKHRFEMEWTGNMKSKRPAVVRALRPDETGGGQFTKVSFKPDWSRFEPGQLDAGSLQLMQTRVAETAALHPNVAVTWNGERVALDGFAAYASRLVPEEPLVVHTLRKHFQIGVAGTAAGPLHASFVNSVSTVRGGTHVEAVQDAVAEAVREHCNARLDKSATSRVSLADVKKHLAVFVNCRVRNADFEGQTKDALLTKPGELLQGGGELRLPDALVKRVCTETSVVQRVLEAATDKVDRALRRAAGSSRSKLLGIKKLDDAAAAGHRTKAELCTLILTEGDSAKALAVAGISSLPNKTRDLYGVFPLRGKPLNARDVAKEAIAKNVEMTHLMTILGLEQGKEYPADPAEPTGLRYGRVMFMTDQDHDGSHIKGLLINFVHELWPSLVRRPGFLCQFRTPLLKARRHGEAKWTLEFFSQNEYEEWRLALPADAKFDVKWYKGLGTSTAQEAKAYFGDLGKHVVEFSPSSRDDDLLDMAFAKGRAADRRRWLQAFSAQPPHAHEPAGGHVTFAEFVEQELVQYSWHDVERSIPSAIDGLKPSQRKVLHASFLRAGRRGASERDEVKVVQLAGFVAESTAYHHGEASLHATIVGMAQDFVGANNAPLLVPAGQFGTRAEGGKDAAAPRYIFTRLHRNARLFFPKPDDALLPPRLEDGQPVEPQSFVPVVPTVLINGAQGIGTGWSSFVPSHHPLDVSARVEAMLRGTDPSAGGPLRPWFRGFTGKIEQTGPTVFQTFGKAERASSTSLVVSELPVGVWTEDFKERVEKLARERKVEGAVKLVERHTEKSVLFDISAPAAKLDELLGGKTPFEALKLHSSMHTTNMNLLDHHGKICHYATTDEILRAFFPVRLALYEARHEAEVARLQAETRALDKEAFATQLIAQAKVRVLGVSRGDLLAALSGFGVEEAVARKVVEKPLQDLTVDRVDLLDKSVLKARARLAEACMLTPESRWLADLGDIRAEFEGV